MGGDRELRLKGEIPVFLSSTFCVGCAEINASYSISGGGKLPWLTRCLPSYTPSLSDLFLLENPFSNSQVRIQYDVLSLELWYKRAFSRVRTLERRQNPLV